MKVAVIETEVGGAVGGRFTFQETLISAIESFKPESHHEFVRIPRGISAHSSGSLPQKLRRASQMAGARMTEVANRIQDEVGGRRIVSLRSSLERELDRQEVDVVWFPTMYAEACSRPTIYTVLDVELIRQPWFPEAAESGGYEWRRQQLERYACKATRIIVPNEAGARQLEEIFGISRSRILCLPHPTPEFARLAASRTDPSEDIAKRLGIRRPFLFYPAQYWPHKNHATLLRVILELEDSGDDFDLACVGSDQGVLPHIRRLAQELGVADRVHHLGFVDNSELIALYRQAHALVYLSWFGPENLPPLEAFALGCPAVCSVVDGAKEQFGDAAALVDPLDVPAIAAAIRNLRDPETRELFIERGKECAAERSPDRYVSGVVDFLDEFEDILRCWR